MVDFILSNTKQSKQCQNYIQQKQQVAYKGNEESRQNVLHCQQVHCPPSSPAETSGQPQETREFSVSIQELVLILG
jgi:hypothetical protein